MDPEDHETNFNLGNYYLDNTTDHDKSLDFYQRAADSAPDQRTRVKCLYNMAKVHEEQEDNQKAIKLYQ